MSRPLILCVVVGGIAALAPRCGGSAPTTADSVRWTPEQQAAAKASGVPVETTNSIGMKFVLIPAGEFQMGSRESADELAKAYKDYGNLPAGLLRSQGYPLHHVRITKPFYLGQHEITVGQFRQFIKDSGYKTDAEKGTFFTGAHGWNSENKKFELG